MTAATQAAAHARRPGPVLVGMKTFQIVVLGAGYTGLMAALGAARRTRRLGGRVTLVNPSSRFTERLRMHQIASGQRLADRPIPHLIAGSGIEFVEGRAERLDPARRTISVVAADGAEREIGYDVAVIALGSVADTVTVPGADAHAFTLDSPHTAARLAERLAAEPGGTVAVVGAGLTGVEAAGEIAERHPGGEVVLLGREEPGPMMSAPAREYLGRALERLGVRVRAGVAVARVRPDGVELAGGEVVPAAAVLWTTGFSARPLAREAGLAVDEKGRVVVDDTLRSVSHPDIYAVGDSAAIRQAWGTIHGTCQSGIPTGAYRRRRHRPPPARPPGEAVPLRLLPPAGLAGPPRRGHPVHPPRRLAEAVLPEGPGGRALQGAGDQQPAALLPHGAAGHAALRGLRPQPRPRASSVNGGR
ncbi:NAD(P)/FAD-dependent oxidoreductase [Dactylosporangium sp. CA-139066]|uniref:NAD(P)/FAD-dependent oxidoreductase n=1 Tax=Dactylosporangium sp. CA-139066 TaxID=3239930 RepID=UPI003D8D24C6